MKEIVSLLLSGIFTLCAGAFAQPGTNTAQEPLAPATTVQSQDAGETAEADTYVCPIATCTNTQAHSHTVCPLQDCGESASHQHAGVAYAGHHDGDGHGNCGATACTVAGCTQTGSHAHNEGAGHNRGGNGHGGNHH